MTAKILTMQTSTMGAYMRNQSKEKIREVSSPTGMASGGGDDDTKWPGFLRVLALPWLGRNTARQILKDDSLFLIPASLVQEEFSAHSNLLLLVFTSLH